MGIARHFNTVTAGIGTPANSFETYNAITFFTWVIQDANLGLKALAGRLFSAASGWMVWKNASNQIVLQMNAELALFPAPDLSTWKFIAVAWGRNFSGVGIADGVARFYVGTTPANLTLVSSVSMLTTGVAEIGFSRIYVGAGSTQELMGCTAWNGSLDQPGIYNREFNIAQLREAMACGFADHVGCKFLVPINGTNPEPCIFNLVDDTTSIINDTTVVSGPNVGCDFIETVPPVYPPPIVYPPITGACEITVEDPYDELTISQVCVDVLFDTSEIVTPPGTGEGGPVFPPDVFPPDVFPPGMFP